MKKIVLSADLHSILPTLTDSVLIVDANGKLVGSFIIAEHMMGPRISDEERQRRLNSNEKRLTTAELLASFENANVPS